MYILLIWNKRHPEDKYWIKKETITEAWRAEEIWKEDNKYGVEIVKIQK